MKKKSWNKNFEKKKASKNFGKKYFETKIFIRKIHNTINQCDTIFALLAPLDRDKEKGRRLFIESNEKVSGKKSVTK